jgi:hypothetical protein
VAEDDRDRVVVPEWDDWWYVDIADLEDESPESAAESPAEDPPAERAHA